MEKQKSACGRHCQLKLIRYARRTFLGLCWRCSGWESACSAGGTDVLSWVRRCPRRLGRAARSVRLRLLSPLAAATEAHSPSTCAVSRAEPIQWEACSVYKEEPLATTRGSLHAATKTCITKPPCTFRGKYRKKKKRHKFFSPFSVTALREFHFLYISSLRGTHSPILPPHAITSCCCIFFWSVYSENLFLKHDVRVHTSQSETCFLMISFPNIT